MGRRTESEIYGEDFMSGNEPAQFLDWYEEQIDKIIRNKEEILVYRMDDVTVLR